MPNLDNPMTPENSTTLSGAACVLDQPDDVLSDPNLTTTEKREILAALASDARAVSDPPALRLLDSGSVVEVDEVLRALHVLDAPDAKCQSTAPMRRIKVRRRRSLTRLLVTLKRRDHDDDDDPPPCPAAALPPGLAFARPRGWMPSDCPEPIAA